MTTTYLIKLLIATGCTTILLRAFPFLAFGASKNPPKLVTDLGKLISPAAMAMLVVYCYCSFFDHASFAEKYFGAAEWIAGLVVVVLHLTVKNPLVSILAGTAAYMVLIQYVFC